MPYIIDTNVAIQLRDGDPSVRAKVDALDDIILLSIVSRVELEGGVQQGRPQAALRRARLDLLFAGLPVVPFESADADAYRDIVAATGYSRRKLLDRMIAAQALVHRATLVTMNPSDFADVPGLDLVAW